MRLTPLEQKIDTLLRPAIADLGFNLVLVEFKSGVLQILVEKPDLSPISLDDCSRINKIISPLLEVEDPIAGAYTLEISSPGIDRPLILPEDFNRYNGFEAKIELEHPLENGQKRFRGRLLGCKDNAIALDVDGQPVTLSFDGIKKARLVLTDELIKTTRAWQKETAKIAS